MFFSSFSKVLRIISIYVYSIRSFRIGQSDENQTIIHDNLKIKTKEIELIQITITCRVTHKTVHQLNTNKYTKMFVEMSEYCYPMKKREGIGDRKDGITP